MIVLREQADKLGTSDSGALEMKGKLKTLQREIEQKVGMYAPIEGGMGLAW